jgi:hypothetical protein
MIFLNACCAVLNSVDRRGVFTQPDGTTYDGEFDSDCCQGNLAAIYSLVAAFVKSFEQLHNDFSLHHRHLFSPPFASAITHIHSRLPPLSQLSHVNGLQVEAF